MIRRIVISWLLTSLAVFCCACCGIRRGDVVLLPNGFEGWVVIRYEVSNTPVLEREGFRNVVRVPTSGEFSTNSKRAVGYGFDTYYFVDVAGKRQRIRAWDEHCERQEVCVQQFQLFSSPSIATIFFVGKKDDVPRHPKPEFRDSLVRCGSGLAGVLVWGRSRGRLGPGL
jgi:hypothetical protein